MSRNRVPIQGPQMSRRNMLAALGVAGAAAASLPVLSACGVGGKASRGSTDATLAYTRPLNDPVVVGR